jgi:hypothetical protein
LGVLICLHSGSQNCVLNECLLDYLISVSVTDVVSYGLGTMMISNEQVRICDVLIMACFRVMSRHLCERAEEKHETSLDR